MTKISEKTLKFLGMIERGKRMREWRSSNGLSQSEAAMEIGICRQTWASWENGKRSPMSFAEEEKLNVLLSKLEDQDV